MTAAAYVFPNAIENLGKKLENWSTTGTQDSFSVGLIASGTYTRASGNYGYATVSQFLAGDGTHGALTEVSTGGYARLALPTPTFTTTALVSTFTCGTMSWTATANYSAVYAFFYDGGISSANDATTNELIAYWDFGGTVSVVSGGNFTLTVSTSPAGLITFTAPA